MKEAEFKVWLEAFGANTPAGRNTRTRAVRTIEKNLAELGLFEVVPENWTGC